MNPFTELRTRIQAQQSKVAIWGCGLLGTTNLVYVANAGYYTTGIEINSDRVEQLKRGDFGLKSDLAVLGKSNESDIRSKIEVTTDWESVLTEEFDIHLVCVPTERNGEPFHIPLLDVMNKIAGYVSTRPILVIVESTIVPAWIQEYVVNVLEQNGHEIGKSVLLGTAPRRDLFGEASFSLRESNRVIGGDSKHTLELMYDFYGTYCEQLVGAKDPEHAMLSKIVENMFRYQSITLANQVMMSLPGFDTSHVLSLAASKWNMELYHPSLGIGGYCVPLAPKYFLSEVGHNGDVMPSLIETAMSYNQTYADEVFQRLLPLLEGKRSIALLGISYIPNIKVAVGSIAKRWTQLFQQHGLSVGVHDPYMTDSELASVAEDAQMIDLPQDLSNYDAVCILTDHACYREIEGLLEQLADQCLVIDNFGTWKDISNSNKIMYYELGTLLSTEGGLAKRDSELYAVI